MHFSLMHRNSINSQKNFRKFMAQLLIKKAKNHILQRTKKQVIIFKTNKKNISNIKEKGI